MDSNHTGIAVATATHLTSETPRFSTSYKSQLSRKSITTLAKYIYSAPYWDRTSVKTFVEFYAYSITPTEQNYSLESCDHLIVNCGYDLMPIRIFRGY